ncbi:MAG TPA: Gfo/Idh/MocA family oxidoreductase [Candidatus Hydrogenedentes bacterium]|nr:Gfo/Idh/MocA family oxidoreductase [Candidatus Hydrogenedentota bacterium]
MDMNRRTFIAGTAAAAAGAVARTARAQSPNGRLGVGVIGCGGRSETHIGTLLEMEKTDKTVEIVALCDIYRPRLEKKAALVGRPVRLYRDYRELLADPAVDMVTIATPDHHHGEQAIAALEAGKHVYCEKPLTHWRQWDLTRRFYEAASTSPAAFQLGAQRMSDSAFRQMKQLVRDGIIGKPIHAECGIFRTGDFGERGMPIDDPEARPGPDLDWDAFLGDAPKRPFDVSRFFRWRMYEDYAGGPVTDLYPHVLTQVIDILGVTHPSHAVATGGKYRYQEREVPDTFNMLVEYPENISIAVLGTQGSNYQGTGGRDDIRIPVIRGWDGALTIQGNDIVFIPDNLADARKERRFPIERGYNVLYLMRNLVECAVTGARTLDSGPALAYHTQTALLMGMTAYREKKTAFFNAERQEITT